MAFKASVKNINPRIWCECALTGLRRLTIAPDFLEDAMSFFLLISRGIDRLNQSVGLFTTWLILATTLISAGNAIVRKAFDSSSNALLEIQWYLFAAVFLLGAGYGLLKNSHVRIDFISSMLSPRTRNWIDVGGILLALFPFCFICIYLSWPLFMQAYTTGEMSSNAGGLIRWPVYALVPAGFALLMLQGVSELIKRLAFLWGQGEDVLSSEEAMSDEQKELIALEKLAQEQVQGAR
jgi:TRAP-type mannitol/chloroaromatic compound transport system permease small subunit